MNLYFFQDSHFVRCIRPNNEKQKENFDNELVLRQLMTSSTVAYAKFIRYGYSKHIPYQKIIDECKWIEEKLKIPSLNRSNLYFRILMPLGFSPKDLKMGREMIFFHSNKYHLIENFFSDAKATSSRKQDQSTAGSSLEKQKNQPR